MSRPRSVQEIREAFLGFYEARDHVRMPSDSLVPSSDPTLLFTGAGMNQFKDEFLGRGRDLKRATTSQKCLRVPDLENVGRTPRHHTFFEMLGNFSFGDYFKAETIPWEWEFFTEVLGWDADRFVATVYEDDEEAFAIWRDAVGLPQERIYRFGEKENFWPSEAPSKGPDGPCGPCSEIYWDQEPGGALPPREGLGELPGRFLEVGNFVFTQFDRQPDGALAPLPQKNIDVGLGLERIAAVAQGVSNNFETDVFAPTFAALADATGRRYGADARDDERMRRIADHARAVFFCIADGVIPGREGRGYVVRKILRRAVRDLIELGLERPFLGELLPAVQRTMGEAYPQLREQQGTISAFVGGEEERFREVYERGITRLEEAVGRIRRQRGASVFPGEIAFELHDTYGFPSDIAAVVVREHGLAFDEEGFERAMEEQRDRARSGSGMQGDVFSESVAQALRQAHGNPPRTEFVGHDEDECEARLLQFFDPAEKEAFPQFPAQRQKRHADGDHPVYVFLDRTPFYAEGGGQVGDRGRLLDPASGAPLFEVLDVQDEDGYYAHACRWIGPADHGTVKASQQVVARVDAAARRATEVHHTATHLLHAALKQVLGEHVHQAGSLVAPDRLRFDYTHPEALSAEQRRAIEDRVHEQVLRAAEVRRRFTTLEQAKAEGVVALFGEKYADEVRVIDVPGFSQELCGGTHVRNTGAIGPFRLLSDRALSAGVRRLEAVAGHAALRQWHGERDTLERLEAELKSPADRLLERVRGLKEQLKEAKRRRSTELPDAAALAEELAGQDAPLAWKHLPGAEADALRSLSDQLRRHDPGAVVLLTGGDEAKVPFVFLCRDGAGVRAGELAKRFGKRLRGGGGGRPDFAQGQGSRGGDLEDAVAELRDALSTAA